MRRTKAEAEQTRHDILKAALIIFDEQGYVQTSLSDIARKAEVTRGAIYWHFDNKEQIVAALAQAQFDDLMRQNAAAISAPDIWQTLGDNFIAYFHELIRSPDRLRFYRAFHQHGKAAPLEKLHQEYLALWQAQCRDAVKRGKENGELRKEADPEYLHFYLSMIISGLIDLCLEQPAHPHLGEYCERAIRDSIAWIKAR